MPLNSKEIFYSGQEVLTNDLAWDQTGRVDQDRFRVSDLWTDGILSDPNGLSNMAVSIDATTNTLFNVGQGTAYANGFRIAIDSNSAFDSTGPTFTTNGICTPRSTGNRGISLADYTNGKANYVWAEYMAALSTGRTSVSFSDASVHYPQEQDGYQIVVSTNNNPGNPVGITNSVYLATVFGQGAGQPLSSNVVTGLTDVSKLYTHIRPNVSVGTGTVRGSTANSGGVQQEILQGTVSTPDLRDSAVSASKIRSSDNFSMNGLSVTGTGTSLLVTNNIDFGGNLYQANVLGITNTSIQNRTVSGVKIGTGTILAENLQDNAVTTSKVNASAITEAKINTSVAGDGLGGGGGSPLSVNVDNSTIEINADTLRVKDAGITQAKLASAVVTQLGQNLGLVSRTHVTIGTVGATVLNVTSATQGRLDGICLVMVNGDGSAGSYLRITVDGTLLGNITSIAGSQTVYIAFNDGNSTTMFKTVVGTVINALNMFFRDSLLIEAQAAGGGASIEAYVQYERQA